MGNPRGGTYKQYRERIRESAFSKGGVVKGALETQIGGDHYKKWTIQPIEFITKNKLSFLQGCIVKRIVRYNQNGGKGLQDLEKIKHEIDLIIELEGLE